MLENCIDHVQGQHSYDVKCKKKKITLQFAIIHVRVYMYMRKKVMLHVHC